MATRRTARGGVLVVGGGFAGGYVARLLGKRGSTIVSDDSFMLYTPILPEAASGTLEPRHVTVPLRLMCPHAELIIGRATALDEEARIVTVEAEAGRWEVEYEELVLAVGAVSRMLPIPGLAEHALQFKDLADAIVLRDHVLRELEGAAAEVDPAQAARHLTFVFVGAGYAGVEALAELSDLVRDALRHYPREVRDHPQRWILVDAAERILPEIPRPLGDYAAQELARRGIELRTSTTLERAEPGFVHLSDGEQIEAHTLVWTAGVKPNPGLMSLGLPLDERGRIVVRPSLQVEGREHVWSLGDCARVPNAAPREEPARRAEAVPVPVLGQVATLGRYRGIADVMGLRLRGFPGWFVTRTYHLYQLPLLSRKLRVVVDWTVALFFRRDIAELGTPARRGPE